jgi:hypothetical protein
VHWKVPPEGCCWAWRFADGVAVYHSLVGSTHVLPAFAWQVLMALIQGCEDEASLSSHLALRGWFPAPEELTETLSTLQVADLASRRF